MSELKRAQLYDDPCAGRRHHEKSRFRGLGNAHIQYPSGIVSRHLYTRHACSLFDVSHMGRLLVEGPDRLAFLQHVLTSNVAGLDLNMAQYCIIPPRRQRPTDDAHICTALRKSGICWWSTPPTPAKRDLAHWRPPGRSLTAPSPTSQPSHAAIAVQGPKSKELLQILSGGVAITEPMKNALNTLTFEGRTVRVAKTGYTGEPLGYEVYIESAEAAWLWNRLVELGAKPAGLGARDTLRLEAALPLYGHEMGADPEGAPMPIFAVPLAKFAVSFAPQRETTSAGLPWSSNMPPSAGS
ncbi:MAG: hypothetical protein ACLSHU_03965 [Oscillospiraceae bacterium]